MNKVWEPTRDEWRAYCDEHGLLTWISADIWDAHDKITAFATHVKGLKAVEGHTVLQGIIDAAEAALDALEMLDVEVQEIGPIRYEHQ